MSLYIPNTIQEFFSVHQFDDRGFKTVLLKQFSQDINKQILKGDRQQCVKPAEDSRLRSSRRSRSNIQKCKKFIKAYEFIKFKLSYLLLYFFYTDFFNFLNLLIFKNRTRNVRIF